MPAPARVGPVLLALLLLALAGCGGEDDPKPTAASAAKQTAPADFPKPRGRSLAELRRGLPEGPVLAPSVGLVEPGTNRFGFGLFDRSNKQVAQAAAAVYVAPVGGGRARGPYWARSESLQVRPPFRSESSSADPDSARSVYVADLPFRRAGDYELLALVRLDGRLVAAASAAGALRVVKNGPVPRVGEAVKRISTPVKTDPGGIDAIETRVPPDSMHEVDFADVVGKRPVVLLFSTPALCQSRVCGPVSDVAEQVKADHDGDVAFVHMEIYRDNQLEKGVRPQVSAFGLPSEPWAFAIDRRGRVAARLEGAFSVRELQAAVKAAERG